MIQVERRPAVSPGGLEANSESAEGGRPANPDRRAPDTAVKTAESDEAFETPRGSKLESPRRNSRSQHDLAKTGSGSSLRSDVATVALCVGIFVLSILARAYHSYLPRAKLEVVLAHYDEDLSWTEKLIPPKVRLTVYTKAPDSHSRPENSRVLPNVGREGHTFLHHIVNNYHNLADWTVFSQAVRPSFGFRGGSKESGHLISGSSFVDYLRPDEEEGFFMVFSAATRYPEIYHSDRYQLMFFDRDSDGAICPREGPHGWNNWWHDINHPVAYHMSRHNDSESSSPVNFYNKYVAAANDAEADLDNADADDNSPTTTTTTTYKNFTLAYANGARFAASRERIHTRPLAYYERLLEQLSKNRNPVEGYYLEAMWYDVFHPESLQAETGPVCSLRSSAKAMSWQAMADSAKWEYFYTHDVDHSKIMLSGAYIMSSPPSTTFAPTTSAPIMDLPVIIEETAAVPTASPVTGIPSTSSGTTSDDPGRSSGSGSGSIPGGVSDPTSGPTAAPNTIAPSAAPDTIAPSAAPTTAVPTRPSPDSAFSQGIGAGGSENSASSNDSVAESMGLIIGLAVGVPVLIAAVAFTAYRMKQRAAQYHYGEGALGMPSPDAWDEEELVVI